MALSTKYHGIDIEFDEHRERWVFTVNGRERSSESLKLAKEAIDKPAPKDKKTFTPVNVLCCNSYGIDLDAEFSPATVTSIAEVSYGDQHVWLKKGTKRTKERSSNLYLDSEENKNIIKQLQELTNQYHELSRRAKALGNKLKKYVPPAE